MDFDIQEANLNLDFEKPKQRKCFKLAGSYDCTFKEKMTPIILITIGWSNSVETTNLANTN
jgi:hypothetical protein